MFISIYLNQTTSTRFPDSNVSVNKRMLDEVTSALGATLSYRSSLDHVRYDEDGEILPESSVGKVGTGTTNLLYDVPGVVLYIHTYNNVPGAENFNIITA